VLALALAFTYLRGASSDPLRWEEPRRALVAMEMIHRGDWVVPRLLGEPYLNKPPLQSWLIAAFALGDARRIGPLAVRLPSLLAVAAIALVLWRLGLSRDSGPHALPALVFLTFGIVAQYGRPGEIDLAFAFWTTAALAAFEWGRRRSSPAVEWVLSQALAGAGVLTKGLAPVFVHPPMLLAAWRERRSHPPRAAAIAVGLAVLAAVVAVWIVPYAVAGPLPALRDRLQAEVAQRTVAAGPADALVHLARYPLVLAGAALPWSIALLALVRPRTRAAMRAAWRGVLTDGYLALAAAVVSWGVLVFLFVPGTLPRYLIPVLPFAAALVAALLFRIDVRWRLTRLLLATGAVYGLVYAGVVDARAAERHRALVAAAEALAAHVRPDVPLVVAEGTDRKLTWPLAHRLDRLVVERAPEGPHDYVAESGRPPDRRARPVIEAGGYALWRVRPLPPERPTGGR
jgi:4-amino-4-deoxy-L-arabinose transferase-like glycosyltransferase